MAGALYQQVSDDLLGRISGKGFEKGAMLPSEAALCEEYGVSRITIRAAISQLVEMGLLVRRPGVGTFVTGQAHDTRTFNLVGFLEEGRLFASDPVSNDVIPADARLSRALDLEAGAQVRRMRTLVHRDGDPLTVADGYSPDAPGTRLSEDDYRRPVASGIAIGIRTRRKVHRAEQTLEPCAAEGAVARLLKLEAGTPIIRAKRVYYTAKDEPIYYLEVQYHPSHYSFSIDLVLRPGGAEIGFLPSAPVTP